MEGDKPKTPDLQQILLEDRCRYCGLCVEVCKPGALTYGNWPR
jgi:ferredoxin